MSYIRIHICLRLQSSHNRFQPHQMLCPRANITPIDYDPGATRVNQENRIKLMLSVAKERLGQSGGTPPQGGAAEKVPVYGGMEVPAVHVPGFAEKLPANG